MDLRFVGFLVQNLGVNSLVFKELDQIEQWGEEYYNDYVAFPIPHTALQPTTFDDWYNCLKYKITMFLEKGLQMLKYLSMATAITL